MSKEECFKKYFNCLRYRKSQVNYLINRLKDYGYYTKEIKIDLNGNFILIVEYDKKLLNYYCRNLHQCYEVLDNLLYLKVKENSKQIMKDFYMERNKFNENISKSC